jgi:putative phage-type endonuclease
MMTDEERAAWLQERCGYITASRLADVMAKGRNGAESRDRVNYRAQLVAERLTGRVVESYQSAEMKRGIDLEDIAVAHFEKVKNVLVDRTCFIKHPTIPMFGASPDRLVGLTQLLEIKCPNTATHIEYLLSKEIPRDYQLQMLGQLACTGRSMCYWMSFDDRMPEDMRSIIIEFTADPIKKQEMETAVIQFNKEVEELIAKLKSAK